MKKVLQIIVFSIGLIFCQLNAQSKKVIEELPYFRNSSDFLYLQAGVNSSSTVIQWTMTEELVFH